MVDRELLRDVNVALCTNIPLGSKLIAKSLGYYLAETEY